jgi:hypothetical protein
VPNDCKLPEGAIKRKPSDTLAWAVNFLAAGLKLSIQIVFHYMVVSAPLIL